jgi:hypothetical protein
MKKTIQTAQDVFAHFGVKVTPKSTLNINNKKLSKVVGADFACVEVFPGQTMFSVCNLPAEPVVVHLPCTPAALDKAVAKMKAA